MTPTRSKLLHARKTYSQCARLVEGQIRVAPQLDPVLSERIIGLGIAADWVRRAAEMETVVFMGNQLDSSPRKASFIELTRYGFAWYGINAIFARNELLDLVGPRKSASELDRFTVLFQGAALSTAIVSERLNKLHAILREHTAPRLPLAAPGTVVTVLQAIEAKYIPPDTKHGGTGKKVAEAAGSGNFSTLDLPTLLYAFRNWSVHGNALDGSFGGRPKFNVYVEILAETLAEVHLNTTSLLLQRL